MNQNLFWHEEDRGIRGRSGLLGIWEGSADKRSNNAQLLAGVTSFAGVHGNFVGAVLQEAAGVIGRAIGNARHAVGSSAIGGRVGRSEERRVGKECLWKC